MSKVTGFEKGFTSTGRFPYVLARLDCGHVAAVEFEPYKGSCVKCGAPNTLQPAGQATHCAQCGGTCHKITFMPNHHNEADYITRIGDECICKQCVSDAEAVAQFEVLDPAAVHHARYRTWGGQGLYYLYKLDPTSPSNFMLLFSVPAIPAIEKLMREKRICALSPTEAA